MKSENRDTIRCGAVEQSLACLRSRFGIKVGPRPPWMIDVEKRAVGGVGGDQQLLPAGVNQDCRHAGRMTTGGNCCHTRQQFAARPKQHCGFRDGRNAPLDIGDESPPEVFGHGQPRQIRLIADKNVQSSSGI